VSTQGGTRFVGVHLEWGFVVRPWARDHHMVDRRWQIREESFERRGIGRVEGRSAPSADLERGLLEALGIAGRKNDLGALGPGTSSRLQTDPGAPADHDDDLTSQFWRTG